MLLCRLVPCRGSGGWEVYVLVCLVWADMGILGYICSCGDVGWSEVEIEVTGEL